MSIYEIRKALSRTFQGVLKNIVSLGGGMPLEDDLKPLKIGNKTTPIEMSETEVKISGTLNAHSINVNGSAVQTGTDAGATELNELSDVTYSSGDLTITDLDSITASSHLTLVPGGDLILDPASQKVIINATDGLYLDGGGDNYVVQAAPDLVRWYIGGDLIFSMYEGGTSGNLFGFGTSTAGFTQFEPTYDATDTDVNFRTNGNKAFCTFGSGNITDMNLYFPDQSCNCTLLLKQDGTGSRTVTNWKTWDQAAGNESTVVWAGGSAPTLTTTASKLDIISFYWDNDNHKAYGVASLNF